jgi:hypothetical protein
MAINSLGAASAPSFFQGEPAAPMRKAVLAQGPISISAKVKENN